MARHIDHWVRCNPCGVRQRCPTGPDQTRFLVAHLGHGARGGTKVYDWPPKTYPDAGLRHLLQELGPPAHELDYFQG